MPVLRIFVIGLLQRFLEVRRPAQRFSISESTAIRWAQRLSATPRLGPWEEIVARG